MQEDGILILTSKCYILRWKDNIVASSDYEFSLGKLSFDNCESIRKSDGFDLDSISLKEAMKRHSKDDHEDTDIYNELINDDAELIKLGLMKMLELKSVVKNHFVLIHPQYWKVSFNMRSKNIDEIRESNQGFLNNNNLWIPELDNKGCIILKPKQHE